MCRCSSCGQPASPAQRTWRRCWGTSLLYPHLHPPHGSRCSLDAAHKQRWRLGRWVDPGLCRGHAAAVVAAVAAAAAVVVVVVVVV